MENSRKDGYIAGAGFAFIGIVILISAFDQGIFGSGKINGILGLFLTLIGAGSFVFPNVAEILVHWMKNQQENDKVSQHQKNPKDSPQTGIVKGTQNIYYGKSEDKTATNYNRSKVEKRLGEIKSELINLKKAGYKEGSDSKSSLKKEVKGIIHRVYSSNPEAAEKRLIHKVLWIASSSTTESDWQEWYIEDVEGLISTIDIILREMDLE
jgi:hypothetical protein